MTDMMNGKAKTALISGIKRMEIHDGDGIRTTVFFKGCSLKCLWCHNPESIGSEKQLAFYSGKCLRCGTCASLCPENAIKMTENGPLIDRARCTNCFLCADRCPANALEGFGRLMEIGELERILLQDEPFYRYSGGGVTFSGGECLLQKDAVTALAARLHSRGISVDIDTCGNVPREALSAVLPYTDTFLFDIKAMDPEVHRKCTGKTNERILENLKFLSGAGAAIEIRYPLIMGYNDQECAAIGAFLRDLPGIKKVKVLRYHRFAASRYGALGMTLTMPDTETTLSDVRRTVEMLSSCGLRAVSE